MVLKNLDIKKTALEYNLRYEDIHDSLNYYYAQKNKKQNQIVLPKQK